MWTDNNRRNSYYLRDMSEGWRNTFDSLLLCFLSINRHLLVTKDNAQPIRDNGNTCNEYRMHFIPYYAENNTILFHFPIRNLIWMFVKLCNNPFGFTKIQSRYVFALIKSIKFFFWGWKLKYFTVFNGGGLYFFPLAKSI